MDLRLTSEELAFRDEVREFVNSNLPSHIREKSLAGRFHVKDDFVTWQRILHRRGWAAPHWPREYGGAGWTEMQRHIFDEVSCQAGAPQVFPFGVNMIGPTIIKYGTEEQKLKYLQPILRSDIWWCQGFSEPNSGSDLASLSTTAERRGDHYVINGQKTWTSHAHIADMMFGLFRTNPTAKRKQEGISLLLVDMKTPGITIRPIYTLDGGRDINETFFDDVRVPVSNLVGPENEGWNCAKYLLVHERTSNARIGPSKFHLMRLKAIASETMVGGKCLADTPRFRDKLAALEIELMALEMTNLRFLVNACDGKTTGLEPSLLKLKGVEIQQTITELFLEAAGLYALPNQSDAKEATSLVGPSFAASVAPTYLNWRKLSIFGGSNEIQKNIISKSILGM